MAPTDLSAALPAPAHPLAKPGYGKRTAVHADEEPPRPSSYDYAHLPSREAYLAGFIERLPEGAAIDIKTLARTQPLYGQQACRTALRALSLAGHLRRVGDSTGDGRPQHVTRTYFSRAARDDTWWEHFLGVRPVGQGVEADAPAEHVRAEDVRRAPEHRPHGQQPREGRAQLPYGAPESGAPSPDPGPSPSPVPRPRPAGVSVRPRQSEAYEALAALGQRDHRMVLSAVECAELEPLAAEWHERGVRGEQFAYAMVTHLPVPLYSPAGLLRRRLTDKLPPQQPAPSADLPAAPVPQLRLECTDCGVPGTPEALPGGLCRPCRHEAEPEAPGGLSADEVHRRASTMRQAIRDAEKPRPRRSVLAPAR